MRKAFLQSDQNSNGWISLEEFAHILNNDKIEFNVEDLKKLIDLHSEKKNGGITYQDFCKWIGS